MPISQTTRNILADPEHKATFEIQNAQGRMNDERLSLIGVSFIRDRLDVDLKSRLGDSCAKYVSLSLQHVTVERNLTVADDLLYSSAYLKNQLRPSFLPPPAPSFLSLTIFHPPQIEQP